MQAVAPTIAPSYPKISSTVAERLIDEYEDIVDNVPIEIGRGAMSVEARRQRKGQELKAQLKRDMDIVEAQFAEHVKNIEKLAASAKMVMSGAKEAVNEAEKLSTEAAYIKAARFAGNAAVELNRIAELAKTLDAEFGKSWMGHRALSTGKIAEEYKDDFADSRQKIMGDGKLLRAKVNKLAQLETQATAFTRASQQLLIKGKKDKGDAIAIATKMADEIHKLADYMENGKNVGWYAVKTKIKNIDLAVKPPSIKKGLLSNLLSLETDLTSALKIYKNSVKTMTTLWTSGLKTLTPQDQKIKEVALLLKTAKAEYEAAQKTANEATVAVGDAVKDMKVIKAKPVTK